MLRSGQGCRGPNRGSRRQAAGPASGISLCTVAKPGERRLPRLIAYLGLPCGSQHPWQITPPLRGSRRSRAGRRRLMRWGARSRASLVDTSQDTRSTPAPTRMSLRSLVSVSHMDRQDRQDEPDGFLSLFILSILFIHVPFHPSMIFHRSSSKRMLLPKTSISSLLQVSRSEAQPR